KAEPKTATGLPQLEQNPRFTVLPLSKVVVANSGFFFKN
ncbi:MAG: hypothetical protein ACI82A_001899, partial [Candidatus Azotimanducaceae bacterium]